jgi:phage internal scaffolding protein
MSAKIIKFATAYTERKKVTADPEGESLTQQHMKDEVDIRNIIKKHDRTGIIEHIAKGVAQYGDYSEVNEYRENLDFVRAAEESFLALPANIRERFQNNAGNFFEFATNPRNKDAMVEMGLMEAPPIEVEETPSSTSQKGAKATEEAPESGDNP